MAKQKRVTSTQAVTKNQNSYLGRRALAFIVDYIVTNRLSLFVTGIVYGMLNKGDIQVLKGFENIPAGQIIILLISVLVVHGFYFVFLPAKITGGSTMMQKVMQVKVVRQDATPATFKDFLLRYYVGSLVCEGIFYDAFAVILNGVFFGIFQAGSISRIIYAISAITAIASLIFALLDKGQYRFFHDRIAKTYMKDEFVSSGKVF